MLTRLAVLSISQVMRDTNIDRDTERERPDPRRVITAADYQERAGMAIGMAQRVIDLLDAALAVGPDGCSLFVAAEHGPAARVWAETMGMTIVQGAFSQDIQTSDGRTVALVQAPVGSHRVMGHDADPVLEALADGADAARDARKDLP